MKRLDFGPPRSIRFWVTAALVFIVAGCLAIVIDSKASAVHLENTVGVHHVRVSRTAVMRYRINQRHYRVRAAYRARARRIIRNHPHIKSRMCLAFGKDSPHQQFPTIHYTCYHQTMRIGLNLVECGGLAGIGALVATPASVPIAAAAAFGGCEFSKTMNYFQRLCAHSVICRTTPPRRRE